MKFSFDIFVTRGLGDNSYLIHSGDEAAVIDPQRDAWRFTDKADELGLGIKYVFETHVHNDYISGAFEIHDKTGAKLAVPAKGEYKFNHKKMNEGDKIKIGDITIQAWHTPGHTYEHTSWLVSEEKNPVAIFTGGSMLVGSAGRTDLLGHHHTENLTRSQFDTVKRIGSLPDDVKVLPTHGGGSFCSASNPSSDRVSTIKLEKSYNQALRCDTVDEFLNKQLEGLLQYPSYYKYMAPQNRAGVKVVGSLELPTRLSESEFDEEFSRARVIDTRTRDKFASAHIDGTLNIELTLSFGTYIGWLLEYNEPMVFIVDNEKEKENIEEITTQLFRIGIDNIKGYISSDDNFFISKAISKYTLTTHESIREQLDRGEAPIFIDVRDPVEWKNTGVLPNTKKVFLADVPSKLRELRDEFGEKQVYAICVSGERAVISTSYLRSLGMNASVIANGGINQFSSYLKHN